jgi:hypothetical protein
LTKRTFKKIDKKGREEEWSWDETDEVKKALEKLHQDMRDEDDKES